MERRSDTTPGLRYPPKPRIIGKSRHRRTTPCTGTAPGKGAPGGPQMAKSGGPELTKSGGTKLTKSGGTKLTKSGGTKLTKSGGTKLTKSGGTKLTKSGGTKLTKSGESDQRKSCTEHRICTKSSPGIGWEIPAFEKCSKRTETAERPNSRSIAK